MGHCFIFNGDRVSNPIKSVVTNDKGRVSTYKVECGSVSQMFSAIRFKFSEFKVMLGAEVKVGRAAAGIQLLSNSSTNMLCQI